MVRGGVRMARGKRTYSSPQHLVLFRDDGDSATREKVDLLAALALLHGEVAWREDLEVQLTHERLDEHSLLDAVLLLAVALDAQDAHELGVE